MDDDIGRLRQELAALAQRQLELRARIDALTAGAAADDDTASPAVAVAPSAGDARVGRRLVLGGAAALAGTVAGLVTATGSAAAAPLLAIENGQTNAIDHQTTFTNARAGVVGPTGEGLDVDDTDALVLVDNSTSTRVTGVGIRVMGRQSAVVASSVSAGSVIDARTSAPTGVGMTAIASGTTGVGVIASGPGFGIQAGSTGVAGQLTGGAYGLAVGGGRPIVFTGGHGDVGIPVTPGRVGETAFDLEGSLYLCVGDGTPGVWRKVAGPATAGALHLLDQPRRVYDTRPGEAPIGPSNGGPKGSMIDNEVRSVDCTANGAPVPLDAIGVLFNLAVTGTNAAGYLTAWASGLPPLASSMNWSQPGLTLSNSVTIRLGPGARFQLLCGGGGMTHVIVDVAGFYR